ncbi:MAG: ATP synthase F1 subunit gamma [Planctomycetes bacterium]|nr:ATP synthase F1 subunit gamma [Planctomycetota bacterium]
MPSFRETKDRIGAVQNIQQITRAMKMVAAARLRRSDVAIRNLRPYSSRLDHLCARFLQGALGNESPFFERREINAIAVLSVSSDRGLCGAYNNRIVARTRDVLRQVPSHRSHLLAVGTRGITGLRRLGFEVEGEYEGVFNPVHYVTAQQICRRLCDLFLSGEADVVKVVFTEFFSPVRQEVLVRRLLPCPPELQHEEMKQQHERRLPEGMYSAPQTIDEARKLVYLYEPNYDTINERLLIQNLSVQVYRALLEAQASEHGARMVAMDNATENAEEMVQQLTLQMNRLRQENITREILDVVGGAEAVR